MSLPVMLAKIKVTHLQAKFIHNITKNKMGNSRKTGETNDKNIWHADIYKY